MNPPPKKATDPPVPAIERESDLLRVVPDMIRDRLPRGWTVDMQFSPRLAGWRPDGLLEISGPNGETGTLLVEAKLGLEPRAIEPLIAMLEKALVDADLPSQSKGPPMVVSRYISPRARDILEGAGACYGDATGNLRITLQNPALFIEGRGANRNPWREVRELRSLKGRTASRVVRALCDLKPPFGVRQLAKRAKTSASSTVRALEFLSREALVVRDERKQVTEVEVTELIKRWADDFQFAKQNSIRRCFEPRRIENTIERLGRLGGRYAITGSFAASAVAQYAEPRLLALYVQDADAAQNQLEVRPESSQSNVWLVQAPDDLPFDRTWDRGGLRYAALSQVACDLLEMPGRAPSEAEELLRWMEVNGNAWRAD